MHGMVQYPMHVYLVSFVLPAITWGMVHAFVPIMHARNWADRVSSVLRAILEKVETPSCADNGLSMGLSLGKIKIVGN